MKHTIAVTVLNRTSSKGRRRADRSRWDENELPAGVADTLHLVDVKNVIVNLLDGRTIVFESPAAEAQRHAQRAAS